jgi:tetratricopeptide (TPR) repeat protein
MLLVEIIAATGAVEAAIVLGQWLAGFDPYEVFHRARMVVAYITSTPQTRPLGTIGSSDVVALVIAASFPAALTLMGDRSRPASSRVLWLVLAAADLGAIGGTACRASLVGALAGGAVVMAARWTHLWRRTMLTMLAVVCLLAAAFLAARIANRRNQLNFGMATTSRTFTWRVSLAQWPGTALLGSGPGTFKFYYMRLEGEWLRAHNFEEERYAGGNNDAQNDFLQARLETGWLGLAALVAVLAWWTRAALAAARSADPEHRNVAAAALGGVLALIVVALVESCLQYSTTRMLLWLWMALPLTYRPEPEKRAPRFGALRWMLAAALIAGFAWDAGRIVLSRYWTERGFRAEFRNDLREAIESDRRAAELDPANREARYYLGRAQWKAADIAGALRTLDDAVRWDSHPRVYEMRIRILYRAGRFPEALRRANEGVRIFPWAGELPAWRNVVMSRIMTEEQPPPAARRRP